MKYLMCLIASAHTVIALVCKYNDDINRASYHLTWAILVVVVYQTINKE